MQEKETSGLKKAEMNLFSSQSEKKGSKVK